MAEVSFLAGMLIDKFVYHLPLYRSTSELIRTTPLATSAPELLKIANT